MIPHFVRKQFFSLGQKPGYISRHRYASTFLEKSIIQSWPKIWLHDLYIEMIPHFLRK